MCRVTRLEPYLVPAACVLRWPTLVFVGIRWPAWACGPVLAVMGQRQPALVVMGLPPA